LRVALGNSSLGPILKAVHSSYAMEHVAKIARGLVVQNSVCQVYSACFKCL